MQNGRRSAPCISRNNKLLKNKPLAAIVLCSVVAFALYVRTLAPTVYTFDSAEFATGAYVLGIIHATGYPLYLLIAKLFTFLPIGDIAYRVNLMSAVFGGVATGLLALVGYRVTGRIWISAAAALFFAFSYYVWREAVIAETYMLNATLISIVILLALSLDDQVGRNANALAATGDRSTVSRHESAGHNFLFKIQHLLSTGSRGRLLLTGLALGLAFSNHMSTILMLPALAYWGWVHRKSIGLFGAIPFGIGTAIGLSFYLYLPLRYMANPPLNYARMYIGTDLTTLPGILSWMSGSMFRAYMANYSFWQAEGQALLYTQWLWINFIGAGVIVGVLGLVQMFRRDRRRAIFFALMYLAYTGFFINYSVLNKDTMFMMSYYAFTIFIAYGARELDDWFSARRSARSASRGPSIVGRPLAPGLAALALIALVVNFSHIDESGNYQAREFAGQLLHDAQPSAFIVTEWTWATPLEYLQIVEGERPDVVIFDRGLYGLPIWNRALAEGLAGDAALDRINQALAERIQSEIGKRPVYATAYIDPLTAEFNFIAQGNYYRLEPRTTAH